MALKHKWLDEARSELKSTLDYVHGVFGDHAVEKAYSEITDCIKTLSLFPDAGMHYSNLVYKGYEVRIFHMKKNSIIYCHDDKTLYILALWNNLQDDSIIVDLLASR